MLGLLSLQLAMQGINRFLQELDLDSVLFLDLTVLDDDLLMVIFNEVL